LTCQTLGSILTGAELKTGTSELKLTQTNAFAFHSGKHIWSAALDNADHGCHTIATGGADGKISLYSLTVPDGSFALSKTTTGQYSAPELPYNDKYQHDLDERDLADVLHRLTSPDGGVVDPLEEPTEQPPTSPPSILLPNGGKAQIKKTKKVAKDGWNRYAFVSQDQFLVTTNFGRVFLSETNPDLKFSEITFPDSDKADLRSYSILKGFPEISRAFLAGSNGNIHVFESGIISKIGKVEGKPADMFKIYDKKTASFELLITTLSASVASLFPISHDSVADEMPIKKVDYTLHDDFVVTSGAMCDSLLILGSRKGSLAVYSSPDGPDFILDGQYGFGGDAVTSILQLPELIRSQGKAYFLSTGRNGTYVIFALHFVHIQGNVKPTDLYPVHRGTPPFGPMVESAWFEGSDLMLCGFKSKNFVVWNVTKQHEVLNVECGGAHRSYAYSTIQRAGDKTLFIYTKASKLCVHSQSNASHDVVKTGGHGREIKSCTISPNQEFFATGAEDTTIRIWKYDEKGLQRSSGFSCLSIIHQHTAGIQHLHWYDSKYLLSSGGNEEFFIWAIEEIPGFGVGVICEAMCPDQSEDRDLRIMSFDVTTAPGPLIIGGNSTLLISLAYSDSTIRIYTYDRVSSFTLIGTGKYTSSCLTQIEHISLTESTLHILTGSTDGSLVTWKLPFQPQSHDENEENSYHPSPPRLEMVSRAKIHQNAIKSLAFSRAAGIQFLLVVTGGDDNALAISIYPENMLTAKPMTFILRSAHAAAITGVCVSPEPSTRGHSLAFRLVSSGNDQIVKEWVIIVYGGNAGRYGVNIEKVGDVHTCVADVGDIANLRNNSKTKKGKILVVGNGMEVWDVDMGKISAANDSSETG
jgi:WD40 repeat protein